MLIFWKKGKTVDLVRCRLNFDVTLECDCKTLLWMIWRARDKVAAIAGTWWNATVIWCTNIVWLWVVIVCLQLGWIIGAYLKNHVISVQKVMHMERPGSLLLMIVIVLVPFSFLFVTTNKFFFRFYILITSYRWVVTYFINN